MNTESFRCSRYQIEIDYEDKIHTIRLIDTYSEVCYADSEYRYSAYIQTEKGLVLLEGLYEARVDERISDRGGRIVVVSGTLGNNPQAPNVKVEQRFFISEEEDYLEERLVLRNAGNSTLPIPGYRFGFRKKLAPSKTYGGPGIDVEAYRLIAVPFRLQPNGQKHDYQLDDLYHGRYQCATSGDPHRFDAPVDDFGRARSEGWAYTDGENGLFLLKYNPNIIEYSMLETERVRDAVYLNFGGAAPALYGEPVNASKLASGGEIAFGKTRFYFYEGLWRRAYYLFRDFITSMGHGMPDNYDPSVTWSLRSPDTRNITAAEVLEEADRAIKLGCGAISLGSAWESVKGSARWDTDRLGSADALLGTLRDEKALAVNINASGRIYADAFPGDYRKSALGNIGFSAPYSESPFYEPCVSYSRYQSNLSRRISEVVKSGVDFVTFREFDWRGPCFDLSHGHTMPSAPGEHAESVLGIVKRLREKHPNLRARMDDPVWPSGVRYLPPYYQYDQGETFVEISAFGFSADPLDALLSGKALALFYYNLAYNVPLTIRLDITKDNENLLAFWYYASTVRHLGICSSYFDKDKFATYQAAMKRYNSLKALYTQGTFYGIDEMVHIHALPLQSRCVINSFNLTDAPVKRSIEIRPNEFGIFDEVCVEGSESCTVGGKLTIDLEIEPFSPSITLLNPV